MADTDVERSQRAELQRTRRLAKRSCGNCGQPAEAMLPWGGLQVAICATCQARLNGPEPRTPWCAFNEIYPMDLRDQVPTAGVLIEARLMPAVELPSTTPVPGGPVPWGAGADAPVRIRSGNQDGAHREIGLKGAALAPIGRNSGKSVLPGWD